MNLLRASAPRCWRFFFVKVVRSKTNPQQQFTTVDKTALEGVTMQDDILTRTQELIVAIEKQQRVAELQAKSISEVTATAKMQSEIVARLQSVQQRCRKVF